ncbi:unannotated protein [freshwater metagenome]|uniref:Unannotated protein n=1 Tax=freshwater metagenome TaxID=449393 RepID=A0A6J6G6G4_9ZZZZ
MTQHGDGQDGEEHHERQHVRDPPTLVPQLQRARRQTIDRLGQWIPDERPLLVIHVLSTGGGLGDAEHLGAETGEADREKRDENDGVFGLRLYADAIRTLDVTAHDGPDDTTGEHQTGEVTHEHVAAVHVAVEELQTLGQLVIELEHRGDTEQNEEAEVDQRVHEAGGRIAQQGAHVHTGAEVGEATLRVGRGGATAIGCTALPVADAIGETQRSPQHEDGDDRVEGQLQRAGDSTEHLAVDGRVTLPSGDEGQHARHHDEHRHERTDGDRELVGLQAPRTRRCGRSLSVRSHAGGTLLASW